jgi:hypothetical protein
VDNDHITRHVYKEWLEIYLSNASPLGRSGTKVAVWAVVVKPVIHYRSIVNLLSYGSLKDKFGRPKKPVKRIISCACINL